MDRDHPLQAFFQNITIVTSDNTQSGQVKSTCLLFRKLPYVGNMNCDLVSFWGFPQQNFKIIIAECLYRLVLFYEMGRDFMKFFCTFQILTNRKLRYTTVKHILFRPYVTLYRENWSLFSVHVSLSKSRTLIL